MTKQFKFIEPVGDYKYSTVVIVDENGNPVNPSGGGVVSLATNDLGRDAWGRPKVINDFTLFSSLWTFSVSNRQWLHFDAPKTPGYPYSEVTGGIPKDNTNKYVSSKNGYLSIVSDGTKNTHLQSAKHLRYQPNKGYLYSSAHILPNPTQIGVREFGLNNGQSGVYFKVVGDGTDWKIYAVKRTTVNGVKEAVNIDITSKILAAIPTFDPSKGHVFDIQMQWRGVGNFFFYVDLVKVYTMDMLGTLTGMSVNNPALSVGFSSYGAETDLELITGCVDVTSEGGHKENKQYTSVTTGIPRINCSNNNNKGSALLAVRIPKYIMYNGHLSEYSRDLALSRINAYCKDEANISFWTGRLVNATNLDAIPSGSDTSNSWVKATDTFYEYMVGGVGSDLDDAFQLDRIENKIITDFSTRHEKDFNLSLENPSPNNAELSITSGMVLVMVVTPDGSGQGAGCTLEFAEEV